MKLKLDLHPIFTEGRHIESALQNVIDEACEKRAAEIEIIPGKGSGALKKTVLRFLDRPEIKSRYHRIEKDSENWGRLFVHFRWDRGQPAPTAREAVEMTNANCFCCQAIISVPVDRELLEAQAHSMIKIDCPSCSSPNVVTVELDRRRKLRTRVEQGYE